ncbi:MAG: hypothetical protein WBP81_05755 [Solirubrobacteraceae bacterium]
MLSRIAGRIITGPLAFFLAGMIDVGAFALAALRKAMRDRVGSRRR